MLVQYFIQLSNLTVHRDEVGETSFDLTYSRGTVHEAVRSWKKARRDPRSGRGG